MSVLLIDDQGEIWDAGSRRLRMSFDSPFSGGEFTNYAIANLGFVGVNLFGSSCQVRLRPSFVSAATVAATRSWLEQTRNERVVLTWLDKDWRNEIWRDPSALNQRLADLFTLGQGASPQDFLMRDLTLGDVHPNSPLGVLLREWQTFAVPSGQHALMRLIEATLGDRFVVARRDTDAGRMLFHEIGPGLYGDYETWRACAVGAPMTEQPDRQFGRWVEAAYRGTMDLGRPTIADVDAIIRWPRAGRARMRYKRIIVPLQGAGDEPLVLGGSLLDNRIDLRVGLG